MADEAAGRVVATADIGCVVAEALGVGVFGCDTGAAVGTDVAFGAGDGAGIGADAGVEGGT